MHEVAVAGAVYSPVVLPIVPHVAVQFAVRLAENCTVPLIPTVGLCGDIAIGGVPVPVSEAFCGLELEVSVKANVAVRVPVAIGLNAIVAVQVPDAARLVPQVLLEMLKSLPFVPEIPMLLMLIVLAPLLVSVTGFVPPLAPTATVPHARLDGPTVAPALDDAPVPERGTV